MSNYWDGYLVFGTEWTYWIGSWLEDSWTTMSKLVLEIVQEQNISRN